MKKSGILFLILISVVLTCVIADAGKPPPPVGTNLIVGRPAKGMYCADPAGWINQGYSGANGIFVWGNATPVKAQVYDANGLLLLPGTGVTFSVNGQTGSMTIGDATNKVYTASPTSARADMIYNNVNTPITYTADGKTFDGVIRRWNAKCDGCHTTPTTLQPNLHLITYKATTPGASRCRECHVLGAKMMSSHAYRVPSNEQTTSDGCYRCHPSPCYGGIHAGKFPGDSIGCVTCHGTLVDAANGQGKFPGQLGFPRCENCHVSLPNQPVPYAQNANTEFKSSVGHGRKRVSLAHNLCITCHNSMHIETKPMSWGDGVNNNCQVCHTTKPTDNNMGPVCGNCHYDSFNPHYVAKSGRW